MTYHGIIEWRFTKDDTESHYSSFSIDRLPGASYALTKIQFINRFNEAIKAEFDCYVEIVNINLKTTNKIAHL